MLGVMSYLTTLLGALVLALAFQQTKESEPYSWASHVCSSSYYSSTYTSYLTSRVYYRHYYTSCGLWGWGRCKRSRAYRTYYYASRTTSQLNTYYYCCSGWRRSGRYCSIPICSSGCVYGSCSSPDTCSCYSGWYGSRCQYDRNECSSSNGGCQQNCINTQGSYRCGCYRGYLKRGSKSCRDYDECNRSPCMCASKSSACGAKCTNTQGSFRCSCGTGFKLVASTACTDVNECSQNVCQQTCFNTIGSYRCSCRQGYRSRQNGTFCDDIDECKANNGDCEQICNNTAGSRQCACKEGYRLEENGLTCRDINECLEDNPCHHNCTNRIGSFTCFCMKGYQLNSDNRTCSDINECQSRKIDGLLHAKYSLSNCEQTCFNTNGSYTCGCQRGFALRRDRRSCKDIDECTRRTHQCNQTCINTRGSYRCGCVTGYELDKDGKSCRALPCPTLVRHAHGKMTCTGMATKDKCSFTCNHGYYLEGTSSITCMPTSRWSDRQAICKAKMCEMLKPPVNSILSLPCFRTYGSSCTMRCVFGYYHTGSSKVSCVLTPDKQGVTWKNDFQCHHVRSCMPNPCRHGGTCTPLTSKDFQCDCSNTGYEGKQCEHGVINVPLFPKLKANLQSSPLSFKAKPSKEIQISIQSDENVVAQPPKLKFLKSSNKAGVTLESKQPGLKVISFSVHGESAKDYTNPAENVLFVSPETPNKNNIFTQIPLLPGELPVGCYMKRTHMFKCPAQLSSTQPWKQNPSTRQFSTNGLVHLITKKGSTIPLSLIGMDFPLKPYEGLLNRVKQISQLNKNVRVKKINSKHACETTTLDVPQVMQLVEHNVFTASFLSTFSKSTPPWMQIREKKISSSFDMKDIHANIGSKSKICSSRFKSSSVITYEPSIGSTITLGEDITLPDERGFCYAIDVCTSDVGFTLPSESTKAIKSSTLFQDLRNAGWDIDLTGAMFPGNGKATVTVGQSLWNGRELENIESQRYEVMLKGTMKTKLENKENVKISLDYQGDVYVNTTNITEVLHYGFARNITGILKGKAALNMTTTIFNKQLNIELPSEDVIGKSIWGVSTLRQGTTLKWKKVPRLLKGTPLNTIIRPEMNQPVFVSLEHQVRGGKLTEIMNLNDYNIKLMLLGFQVLQLKGIVNNPQMNGLAKKENIKRWTKFIDEVNTLVVDIRSAILKPKNTVTFSLLISRLRNKLHDFEFLCKVIESTLKTKMPTTGILLIAQVKQILTNLAQIPHPIFKRSAVSNRFHGFKILFQGKICSKRLCFQRLNVTLESSRPKTDQAQNHSSVTVLGKILKSLQLGKLMSLKKAKKVLLKVPRGETASTLTFNPTINFMGIEKSVSCKIEQDTLSFNTTGLLYGRHEVFMNVSAKTDVSDWSLLQYHVSGKMEKNSRLPQQLQRKINNHIKDLAQKAIKRIEKAENAAIQAKQKHDSFQRTLSEKLKALKSLEEEKSELLKKRRRAKTDYEEQKVYVYDYYGEEVNTFPVCKAKQCEWECSTTKHCTFKTEKLKLTVTQYKCEEKEREVEKDRFVQKRETAYYWKDTFVLVDTGNCGKRHYERVLGPIGAILGGTNIPIPVVGQVVGYFIGHVVGKVLSVLADAIFGCDQTYEMVPGPKKRISYTKVWNERVKYKVTEKVVECSSFQVPKVAENSYAPPKQTCTNDGCIIKLMNAKCVKENNACYNEKQLYRKSPKSQYEKEKFNDFYELNRLANSLEIATINLYKVEAKYDKILEETKMAKAQLQHVELAKNRTEAAILDVKAFPSTKLGLRLSRLLGETRSERTVNVSDFIFDITFIKQTKRQIPISIAVNSIDGKKKDLPALFDFDKEDVSLHKIVTKAVNDLYEERRGARRKRSIPEELYNRINNTGDNPDGIQSLKNHDLCLEAKKANSFYKEIVKSLEDLVDAREQVERVNKDDIEKLDSVYKSFENVTANDTQSGNETETSQGMTKTYLDYVASIIEDKHNYSMMSWNDSLVSWRAFLEVLTKEESFLNCAGAQDCLIDIGEDLGELYLYEGDFAPANDIRMALSNVTARLIDLISYNFTAEEIRYKIWDLHYLLNHTEDTNILCGRKPEITFISVSSEVVVENETLTLFCNATSDTKVTYQWIHNNESVIQSDNGLLTIRKANTSHAGSYKCMAINRKGFDVSNVTIISVKSKPKITEHPNDTNVYAKDGKGLMLVCNATGDPEPDIEWFFISQYPNSSEVKIYNDNGTFLYYENHNTNYSGYYYCIARNTYGQVRSRKAKVWVLDLSPGEPSLGARINVTKRCKSQHSWSWCGKVQAIRDIPYLKKAFTKSLNNPVSNVKNINFASNDLHTATVSFLYASKKTAKEVTNEPVLDPVVETFARKRKTLVNGLQTWYQKLKNDSSPIVTTHYEDIIGNADSLTAWVAQPECSRGQVPHSNGYMCYNCPPGTYGNADGLCTPCPVKTFQYEQGQTKCIPCPYGYTTKREGALSPDECYDMRPSPPRNLQATATSSKMLRVRWLVPKENSKSISSYLIRYRESTSRFKTERVPKTVTAWTLRRLKKFTDYHIVVYAVNSYGMRESKIIAKTGEDVPDAAPGIVQCIPVSYNNMSLMWKPIPEHKRNGIIRGYHIYFKEFTDNNWHVYTTPNGNLTGTIVPGLQSYTEYCVKISAFTSKGEYPDWKRTPCKKLKTPSRPVQVSGRALSPSEILLKFLKQGRSSESNTFVVHYGKQQDRLVVTTACYSSSCVIRNLQEDTVYFFKVLEGVVQAGESAAIIQIRTKKRGS